jgi:hypothetical protein
MENNVAAIGGCQLTWNGASWVETANHCGGGACATPARDGAFIGEVVLVPCLTLGAARKEETREPRRRDPR